MGLFVLMILLFGVAGASFVFYNKARKMEQQQGGQLPPGYAGQLPPGGGFAPVNQGGFGGGGGFGGQDAVAGERNLLNLRINDIVSHFGTDYLVEGRLDYYEDGYTWVNYMLKDGAETRWLNVEQDDELEVSMWREIHDLPISGSRPPEFLEWRGVRLRQVEHGRARVNQQGVVGRRNGIECDYYDYEGPNDERLSVEKWGNEYEVSIGQDIEPYSLDIFPGDAV